jgi:rhamnosyltransferase subunit B
VGRRFVFVAAGSLGEVLPLFAVARHMKAAGDDVLVAANPDYQMLAAGERLPFLPVGESLAAMAPDSSKAPNRVKAYFDVCEKIIIRPLESIVRDLLEVVTESDVLVANPIQPAAALVSRIKGIPWITASPTSWDIPTPDHMPMHYPVRSLGPWLNQAAWNALYWEMDRRYLGAAAEVWRKAGLPGKPKSLLELALSPSRILFLVSPLFVHRRKLPDNATVSGHVPFDTIRVFRAKRELERYLDDGEPPIVFRAPPNLKVGEFQEMAAQICRDLGQRGVFLDMNAEAEGVQGPLWVQRYVPLTVLAPKAKVGVHYGGLGTCVAFAEAGKPAVVTPTHLDQFENARALEALEAAVTLPWQKLNKRRLTSSIDRAMTLTKQAVAAGAKLSQERGAETASALLKAEVAARAEATT